MRSITITKKRRVDAVMGMGIVMTTVTVMTMVTITTIRLRRISTLERL